MPERSVMGQPGALDGARYPFSAIVGLDDLKLALLINAVSPGVGGVLVRGEKGTAKSTIVRGLAALLPAVAVIEGCRFSCDPAQPDSRCPDGPHEPGAGATSRPARLVELPVGASEDRLAGSLDIERALTEGVKEFEPGLLAAAHRGILYVDEVNLLHDHLVDLLLDAAAMGESYVEREGVSVRHAASFLLVGTMNPEEGELRPQLLDRFGVTVEVAGARDPGERAEVVRRRLAYEADPRGFARRWAETDAELAGRVVTARALLPDVTLDDGGLRQITAVCAAFEVDGLRADLVTARAAIALAAWHGRTEVSTEDVRTAARLALPHRRRRNPFDAPGLDEQKLDEVLEQHSEPPQGPEPDPDGPPPPGPPPSGNGQGSEPAGGEQRTPSQAVQGQQPASGGAEGGAAESVAPGRVAAHRVVAAGPPYRPRLLSVPGIGTGALGRRSRARTRYGHLTSARTTPGGFTALHLTATLRAAAPYQRTRGRTGAGLLLAPEDLREAVREGREGNLVLFAVDASGSMAARQRMRAVKGAVLSLLLDAYQRRDRIGLVTFRGSGAELVLPPTWSVETAARRLAELPTGGRTPLAAGLVRAAEVLRVERLRDPDRRPLVVVVTDGKATGGADPMGEAYRAARLITAACVVVDCETGPVRLGLAGALATHLDRAQLVRLEELAADSLAGLVRKVRRVA